MNVCEVLLDILAKYGTKYIFGISGDDINDLLEAIRKQEKIKFIHVLHEESGAFAASAQAKLSGELAVCVGTAGPGAVHLLNGLYDAKMDHAPVLAITGQVSTELIGTSSHQEVNLKHLFDDLCVYNQTLINEEQMPEMAYLACQMALTQKGVSHISIPFNLANKKVTDYEKNNPVLRPEHELKPSIKDLQRAADLINRTDKIAILAGIGARDAVQELLQVAETIKAPVIKALRGKDIIPDNHPYSLGGTGLLGTKPAFHAMKECEVLLVIGSDFPYPEFYPDKKIPVIQVEENESHIGRRHPVSAALVGECKIALNNLLPILKEKKNDDFLKEAQEDMKRWQEKQDEKELSADTPIHPQALARMISDYAPEDAIITCDTGAITVWGARNFKLKGSQRFTLSGGLASMAFALPASIGAQLLFPSKQVIALCGDGGFAMLMADFVTAVRYKLPVKIFVFNNSKLGLIQMEQEANAGNPEYETCLHNPDYAKFADICGGKGYTITEFAQLETTLTEVFNHNKPCIVNVKVNPEEITYPPHISLRHTFNYTKAKIEEFFT